MKNRSSTKSWTWLLDYFGLMAVLGLLVLFFSWKSEYFWTTGTLANIANTLPDYTVVAVGMTFVLLIGGIDLSVGSVLALSGAMIGTATLHWNWPIGLAILLGIGIGAFCGFLNGMISVWWKIPSFIVSLGMLELARGSTLLISDMQIQHIGDSIQFWNQPISGLGVSPAFCIAIGVVLLAQIVLSKTVFGRYMIAIGTNEEAVRLSGINPLPTKVIVFLISGLLAGVAGLIQTSRLSAVDPNAGIGFELSAIAAVVIGGTSLSGGRGSVFKSFLGVLIIAVLESGLVQMTASEPTKRIVTGAVIVLAVITDAYRHNLSMTDLLARWKSKTNPSR